jgi:hypothetical protein
MKSGTNLNSSKSFATAVAIMVVAMVVRSAWVLYCARTGSLVAGGDSWKMGEIAAIAINLAQHRGFSFPFGVGTQPTAWESPIVPSVYAAIIRFLGGATLQAATTIACLQIVVGGFGAGLYWLIVRRLINRNPGKFADWLSPAVANVVCLWPGSVVSVTQVWYFVWQEAALALFLLLAMRWVEKPGPRSAALAGISGGVLALINVTPIPVVLIAIALVAARSRFSRDSLPSTAIALLCFLAVTAPWMTRNTLAFHAFVPLRSNTGYELFQGNNAIECIREPDDAPHPANHKREFELYMQMGEIPYCRYSFHRAVDYIRAHPLQTARRIGDRIYVTWLTDLTDHWMPHDETPWWHGSLAGRMRFLLSALLVIAATVTFVWGMIRGRFASLPYSPMFAAILILLPFPHYLTLADQEYTATFRMLVAITSLCMMALKKEKATEVCPS